MKKKALIILPLLFVVGIISSCSNSTSNDSILSSREECDGVPNCVSVETEFMELSADAIHVLHFNCPDEAPNIHNIDVDQNDNVNVVVINWNEDAVTVKFSNQDPDLDGFYQTFLGCSDISFEDSDGIERFAGRTTLPDGRADVPSDIPHTIPQACNESIPDCVNVVTKRHAVGHARADKVDVHCPNHHYFVRYSDHRSSHSVTITEDPFGKLYLDNKGMTFFVTNWSFHDHHYQIAIACSSACKYVPGGCACDGDDGAHFGCHNDPGCKTTMSMTECDPTNPGNCWQVWSEKCIDGVTWECNTTLGWPCCDRCP
ncbi:MAG: hypothetical protein AAF462_11605 [Thermodesulfobacteriota bacterium]